MEAFDILQHPKKVIPCRGVLFTYLQPFWTIFWVNWGDTGTWVLVLEISMITVIDIWGGDLLAFLLERKDGEPFYRKFGIWFSFSLIGFQGKILATCCHAKKPFDSDPNWHGPRNVFSAILQAVHTTKK